MVCVKERISSSNGELQIAVWQWLAHTWDFISRTCHFTTANRCLTDKVYLVVVFSFLMVFVVVLSCARNARDLLSPGKTHCSLLISKRALLCLQLTVSFPFSLRVRWVRWRSQQAAPVNISWPHNVRPAPVHTTHPRV